MSKSTEFEEVFKRLIETKGTKDGKMLVKGTVYLDGNGPPVTKGIASISLYNCMKSLTEMCNRVVRTVDPSDKCEYIRVNYSNREAAEDEIMVATDETFFGVVVQEHAIRELGKKYPNNTGKDEKLKTVYYYTQEDPFFPSMENRKEQK